MTLLDFFARHPVFRYDEFIAFLAASGPRSPKTVENLLAQHVHRGRLVHIRRSVYLSVPLGFDAQTAPVDPYLVAAKLTPDAVLAYHTALQLHGVAYSLFEEFAYCTAAHTRPLAFRGQRYRPLPFPKALRDAHQEGFAVKAVDRHGLDVRVTSLERTLVDVLDRPAESGGWEEVWRSLESIEYVNPDVVVDYALLLGSVTTNAKVGFFLDRHRQALMVEDRQLDRLRAHLPRSPYYLAPSDRQSGRAGEPGRRGKFVARWNLVVPPAFLAGSWDEAEGEFSAGAEYNTADDTDDEAGGTPHAQAAMAAAATGAAG